MSSRGISAKGSWKHAALDTRNIFMEKARINRWDDSGDNSVSEPSNTSNRGEDDSGSTTSND